MKSLTDNDLKARGTSVVEEGLQLHEELMISVGGQKRYVIIDIERYKHLRELELTAAAVKARSDYTADRYTTESLVSYVQKLKERL